MPIVCEVLPLLPSEPYLVAYSCMPSVLTPLSAIKTHKVVLFAKNVEKWADYYKDCPNVSVQPVGATFQLALAKSSGLIASPSPGAVIQALAARSRAISSYRQGIWSRPATTITTPSIL